MELIYLFLALYLTIQWKRSNEQRKSLKTPVKRKKGPIVKIEGQTVRVRLHSGKKRDKYTGRYTTSTHPNGVFAYD